MIISSLERQKKYLVKLCFDNGEELFLDRDICAENSLCEDMEIEAEELKKLSFESDYRRAKSRALWYLDRSDYTEKAMYQKLLRAGFEKRASAAAIARLVELGVIDDRRFAERYYERCCESNISKREALHKMLNKGITYDLAKETLACSCDSCEGLLENLARIVGPRDTQGLSRGDVLRVGRFSCEVIWPLAFEDEGGNADSLCLLVGYDADGDGASEFRTLLTGDAEAGQLDAMAGSADLRNIDVFKAGHHGSRAGLDEELATHLSPEVVLISVGESNRYGHPAPEVLRLCEAAGASVFRTDEHGDVKCRFEKERIEVSAQNLR